MFQVVKRKHDLDGSRNCQKEPSDLREASKEACPQPGISQDDVGGWKQFRSQHKVDVNQWGPEISQEICDIETFEQGGDVCLGSFEVAKQEGVKESGDYPRKDEEYS